MAGTTIAALRWLGAKEHTFIYWNEASRTYQPTPFGKAVLASGLPPEDCLVLKVGGCRERHGWVRELLFSRGTGLKRQREILPLLGLLCPTLGMPARFIHMLRPPPTHPPTPPLNTGG